jgi:CIC family chloride channel protein
MSRRQAGEGSGRRWARGQVVVAGRTVSRFANSVWDRLLRRLDALGLDENALLLGFAVATGLAAAGGVVLFYLAIDGFHFVLFEWPARALAGVPITLSRPVLTAIAFAAAAALWRRMGAGSDGMTIPDVQLAVVRRGGQIPATPAIGRTLASALTIGGGGSAGAKGRSR